MKIISLILIVSVIMISIVVTGCDSKTKTNIPSDKTVIDTSNTSISESDLLADEEAVDPDIGELDDIVVSDELPQ